MKGKKGGGTAALIEWGEVRKRGFGPGWPGGGTEKGEENGGCLAVSKGGSRWPKYQKGAGWHDKGGERWRSRKNWFQKSRWLDGE